MITSPILLYAVYMTQARLARSLGYGWNTGQICSETRLTRQDRRDWNDEETLL